MYFCKLIFLNNNINLWKKNRTITRESIKNLPNSKTPPWVLWTQKSLDHLEGAHPSPLPTFVHSHSKSLNYYIIFCKILNVLYIFQIGNTFWNNFFTICGIYYHLNTLLLALWTPCMCHLTICSAQLFDCSMSKFTVSYFAYDLLKNTKK